MSCCLIDMQWAVVLWGSKKSNSIIFRLGMWTTYYIFVFTYGLCCKVLIMYGTIVFIVIYGAIDVGGFAFVWEKAVESGRAELIDFDLNPTTRHTFWSMIIGGYFTWITIYGCNQAQVNISPAFTIRYFFKFTRYYTQKKKSFTWKN